MMIMGAAMVKPDITGLEKRLKAKPSFNTPISTCIIPVRMAIITARRAFSVILSPAKSPNPAARISISIATGPMDKWLEVPNKGYTNRGTKPAYNP